MHLQWKKVRNCIRALLRSTIFRLFWNFFLTSQMYLYSEITFIIAYIFLSMQRSMITMKGTIPRWIHTCYRVDLYVLPSNLSERNALTWFLVYKWSRYLQTRWKLTWNECRVHIDLFCITEFHYLPLHLRWGPCHEEEQKLVDSFLRDSIQMYFATLILPPCIYSVPCVMRCHETIVPFFNIKIIL